MSADLRDDVIRVVLPIALYEAGTGSAAQGAKVRASYVKAIRAELVKYVGPNHGFDVSARPDSGIVVKATFRHPRRDGAGAITAAAAIANTLDVVLGRVASRYGDAARRSIEGLGIITIKANGA